MLPREKELQPSVASSNTLLTSNNATGKENKYPETIDRKMEPGMANVCKGELRGITIVNRMIGREYLISYLEKEIC